MVKHTKSLGDRAVVALPDKPMGPDYITRSIGAPKGSVTVSVPGSSPLNARVAHAFTFAFSSSKSTFANSASHLSIRTTPHRWYSNK